MPSVAETSQAPGPLAASLHAGVETLSGRQTVTFTRYVKLILPLDGYVFWVKADLLTPSALYNAAQYNAAALNQPAGVATPAKSFDQLGSIHFATDNRQEQDKTVAVNYMIFTSEDQVNDLNDIGPFAMYIGEFEGQRFSFSQRGSFYKQAGLWHYRGDAIYPVMETQIIDSLDGLDTSNVIVSNSLPIWLGLNKFMPVFPSFLVDANLRPPYCSAHIDPANTEALQMAPVMDSNSNQWQLVTDTVRLTVYGFRNFNSLDYLKYLCDDSLMRSDVWGLMDMPIVQDGKAIQRELGAIAQQKIITLKVNYYQSRIRDIARQLILSAFVSYQPSGV